MEAGADYVLAAVDSRVIVQSSLLPGLLASVWMEGSWHSAAAWCRKLVCSPCVCRGKLRTWSGPGSLGSGSSCIGRRPCAFPGSFALGDGLLLSAQAFGPLPYRNRDELWSSPRRFVWESPGFLTCGFVGFGFLGFGLGAFLGLGSCLGNSNSAWKVLSSVKVWG